MIELFIYAVVIFVGVIASEFIHYQNHEYYYGKKPNGFQRSFYRWFSKRWNNMIIGFTFSAIFVTLIHSGVNNDEITQWALNKAGEGDLTLEVSGYTLTGIFSITVDWLGRKTGIIKPETFIISEE